MPSADQRGAASAQKASGAGGPKARYRLRPVTTPVPAASCDDDAPSGGAPHAAAEPRAANAPSKPARDPFLRPAAEDDDGYDPFSDRPAAPEPVFQEDPWD